MTTTEPRPHGAPWEKHVHWARRVLGSFLDDDPLAADVGQPVRTAITVLTSDAHLRYTPKYPQPVGDPVAMEET